MQRNSSNLRGLRPRHGGPSSNGARPIGHSNVVHPPTINVRLQSPGITSTRHPATGVGSIAIRTNPSTPPLEAHDFPIDLREGIDEGAPLSTSGRLKRNRDDEEEIEDTELVARSYKEMPVAKFQFKQHAHHIRSGFDLYGNLHIIINDGIKRKAASQDGEENLSDIQSDRDYETYNLILDHLVGLEAEILRLHKSPIEFRYLVRKIKQSADSARNNDTSGLKKDVPFFLSPDGCSVLQAIKQNQFATAKNDRGFDHDIMGRYLCPISLNWDDAGTRQKLRDGEIPVTAAVFPRLLYENCECDPDHMEVGLGRNLALLRVVKYIFTGRSSALSNTAGGKTTRAGNAQIAGLKSITPRIIAYGACMLRFALSTRETWNKLDGEFNMEDFYWSVVGIFDDCDEFGASLLAWWNREVLGFSSKSAVSTEVDMKGSSLDLLKAERAAKRTRILHDTTNGRSD